MKNWIRWKNFVIWLDGRFRKNRRLPWKKAESSKTVIMKKWIVFEKQNPKERTGLLIWRPRNGKRPGLKTCGSVIIKYSVIIWKLPIRSKIWFRIIIQESRPLPMRSVISFQNWKSWKIRFWEQRINSVHWNMSFTVRWEILSQQS